MGTAQTTQTTTTEIAIKAARVLFYTAIIGGSLFVDFMLSTGSIEGLPWASNDPGTWILGPIALPLTQIIAFLLIVAFSGENWQSNEAKPFFLFLPTLFWYLSYIPAEIHDKLFDASFMQYVGYIDAFGSAGTTIAAFYAAKFLARELRRIKGGVPEMTTEEKFGLVIWLNTAVWFRVFKYALYLYIAGVTFTMYFVASAGFFEVLEEGPAAMGREGPITFIAILVGLGTALAFEVLKTMDGLCKKEPNSSLFLLLPIPFMAIGAILGWIMHEALGIDEQTAGMAWNSVALAGLAAAAALSLRFFYKEALDVFAIAKEGK